MFPDFSILFQTNYPLTTTIIEKDFVLHNSEEFIIAGYIEDSGYKLSILIGMNIFGKKSWYYRYNSSIPTINSVAVDANGNFAVFGDFNSSSSNLNEFISILKTQCFPGEWKVSNTECSECKPGTYSTENDASNCIECDINFFQYYSGQTECEACQGYNYQYYKGQSNCISPEVLSPLPAVLDPAHTGYQGISIIPASNGDFFLMAAGTYSEPTFGNDRSLFRMNQNAAKVWDKKIDGDFYQNSTNIILTSNNSIVFLSVDSSYKVHIFLYREDGDLISDNIIGITSLNLTRVVQGENDTLYVLGNSSGWFKCIWENN